MDDYMKELLADEMGMSFCSIKNSYVSCGPEGSKCCATCKDSIEFEKAIMKEIKYINLAKHCIGLDYEKPYKRHNKLFYKPYRNYFETVPSCNDFNILEQMVLIRYMERSAMSKCGSFTYCLTRKGLDWLSNRLNIKIHNENE